MSIIFPEVHLSKLTAVNLDVNYIKEWVSKEDNKSILDSKSTNVILLFNKDSYYLNKIKNSFECYLICIFDTNKGLVESAGLIENRGEISPDIDKLFKKNDMIMINK